MAESPAPQKVPRHVWNSITTVIVLIIIWIIVKTFGESTERYQYLQSVLVALSLAVLVVYTEFTRRIHESMVRQTVVSILPVFVAAISPGADNRFKYFLRLDNIGNSVALNVTIDPICIQYSVMDDSPDSPGRTELVSFNSKQNIPKGEFANFYESKNAAGARAISMLAAPGDLSLLRFMQPSVAARNYDLVIRFSDILGNKYKQVIRINSAGYYVGTVEPDAYGE